MWNEDEEKKCFGATYSTFLVKLYYKVSYIFQTLFFCLEKNSNSSFVFTLSWSFSTILKLYGRKRLKRNVFKQQTYFSFEFTNFMILDGWFEGPDFDTRKSE